VPQLSAPKWPELSLNSIWPVVQGDKFLMMHFAERTPLDIRPPPRDFFWGVM